MFFYLSLTREPFMFQTLTVSCHSERSEESVNTSRDVFADVIRFFAKAQNDRDIMHMNYLRM